MQYLRTIVTVFALCCVVPSTVYAEEDMERWESLLKRGAEAYEAGDMQTALLLYGQAQAINDAPMLRLQIGDLHEKLGECNAARLVYLQLVEDKSASDKVRASSGKRLAKLDCTAETTSETPPETAEVSEPEPEVASEPEPQVTASTTVDPGPRPRTTLGWTLIGTGGAVTLGGLVVGTGMFLPTGAVDCSTKAECEDYQVSGESRTQAAMRAQDAVRTHRTIATTLMIAGGATLIGGVVVMMTRPKHGSLSLQFGPSSVQATVEF